MRVSYVFTVLGVSFLTDLVNSYFWETRVLLAQVSAHVSLTPLEAFVCMCSKHCSVECQLDKEIYTHTVCIIHVFVLACNCVLFGDCRCVFILGVNIKG